MSAAVFKVPTPGSTRAAPASDADRVRDGLRRCSALVQLLDDTLAGATGSDAQSSDRRALAQEAVSVALRRELEFMEDLMSCANFVAGGAA